MQVVPCCGASLGMTSETFDENARFGAGSLKSLRLALSALD